MNNPFTTGKQSRETIEQKLKCAIGIASETHGHSAVQETESTEVSKHVAVDENKVMGHLTRQEKTAEACARMQKHEIANTIKASATETQKREIEKMLESAVYYHTPETHGIKKEATSVYSAVFLNWRKGVTEIFAQYRKYCAQRSEFAFFVYIEGGVCYFHTPGYNKCSMPCCAAQNTYALLISGMDEMHSIVAENSLVKHSGVYCMSGKSVLFVLDTIINTQASTVNALPFVLSKYCFMNSICTKPSMVARSEKRSTENMYRVNIKGWMVCADLIPLSLKLLGMGVE